MTTYQNEKQGRFAQEYVAQAYDLVVEPDQAEWYDCLNPRNGTKYEVKSTHKTVSGGATGRFRLWADQHRSLVAAASNEGQTAWYAFVLLDSNGEVDDVRRMRPSTVTELVDGWNQAGHKERDGPQHKLPWTEVFD